MYTMKVLTITLLACAVTVIQPVEAQFTVDFAEPIYAIAENNNLTIRVQTNLEDVLPVGFDFEFNITVKVKEDLQCTPSSDIRLPNGNTTTLMFNRSFPTATFDVEVICDDIVEFNQRCTLEFDPPNIAGFTQGLRSTVVEIAECEEDYIECKWNTSLVEVTEGEGVEVMLFSSCSRRQFSGVIPINVLCVNNSAPGVTPASEGSDWIVKSTTVLFTSSATFNPNTDDLFAEEPIVISIVNDECAEPLESLICSLQVGVVQSVRTVDPKQVTVVINDDDVLEVFWAEPSYCFSESDVNALTTLRTNSCFNGSIGLTAFPKPVVTDIVSNVTFNTTFLNQRVQQRIDFARFNDTEYAVGAIIGDVLEMNPRFTLTATFASSNMSATLASSNFTIPNNDIYEYDKLVMADFQFSQFVQTNYQERVGEPNVTLIVIKDDDNVKVNFTEESYTVNESVGTVTITMRVTGKYFVLMNGTVSCKEGSADGDDFKFNEATVQFPMPFIPRQAADTTDVDLTITIVDDDIYEERECFTCTIHNSSVPEKELRCPPQTTTICIVDPAITCGFRQNVTVPEGSLAVLQIICDQVTDTNITFSVTTMDDTANSPSDYLGGTFSVTIPAGSSMANLPVQTIKNDSVEVDEVFKATLTVPGGSDRVLVGIDTAYVTIIDASDVTCGFTQNASIHEGSPAELKVVCDQAPITNITLTVTTMDITANSPSDYSGGTFTVTIPARETMGSLEIPTVKTDEVEDDEDFKATLSNPDGPDNVMVGIDTAYVTIVDRTVLVRFNPATYTVTEEEDANAVITLETIGAHSDVINVTVSARSGNATSDSDYRGAMFSVSLPPTNDNISTVTFNVSILDDSVVECPELLVLELDIPPAAEARCVREVAPDAAQVLIYDNDVAAVSFNPQNYTVSEGSSVELIIVLDQPACQDISVNVTTVDGTAVDGVDYTGKSSVVSFPAGETRRSFPIATIHDTFVERNDYFKANLSHPLNGPVVFGTPTIAFVNIIDDDVVTISFSTQSYTVPEGSFVNLIIVADKVSPEDITVVVTTTDITTDPDDYDGGTLTCIIPQGENETSCPPLRTHLNVPSEDNEVFRATLSLPAGPDYASVGPDAFVTITDITVVVSFAQSEYIFNETSEREGPITVLARGNLSESNFSIPVTVTDGTATGGGNDYEDPISTPLSFGQDQPSARFPFIPICDEVRDEGNESAQLTITVPPQYQDYVTTEQPSTTTVIIIDICPGPGTGDPLPVIPVNDTVMADPLFTVPIDTRNTSDILEGTPLCYEVHGRNNTYLNLVTDDCTSVNAYTMEFLVEWEPGEIEAVNVIRVIGVVATDAADECHYIRVQVTDSGMCIAEVDGDSLDSAMLEKNNMTVYHKNNMVRISVPNCEAQRRRHLVMWVRCQKLRVTDISGDEYTMTKFIISRGLKHRALAHGLIGQFWGVPFTVVDREMDGENYTLTMVPPALPDQDAPRNRTFPAMLSDKTWSLDHKFAMPDSKCLYVGNSQGGPESSFVDSVIEGNWTDYITDSLYETNWTFSRYNAGTCP